MSQDLSQSTEPSLGASNPTEPDPTSKITSLATLSLKDGLGAALTKQGKYAEAATLLQEVLTTRESLNEDRTSQGMLCTMNNLAAALQHQGHFASAEALHRRVLEADTQTLGISHPYTLTSMHNLAVVLAHQNPDQGPDSAKLSEAAELLQQALQRSQPTNGTWSPQSLQIAGEQVKVLLRQKKYNEAEVLAREVLAQRRNLLPAQHPEIAAAMHDLAVVLTKVGKANEAEMLEREERAFLENDADDIGASKDGDGLAAMEEGRYKAAEHIYRKELAASMA